MKIMKFWIISLKIPKLSDNKKLLQLLQQTKEYVIYASDDNLKIIKKFTKEIQDANK